MPETRKEYDREPREGAVPIVEQTGESIAAVARDPGVDEGTLGTWVARAKQARDGTQGLSTSQRALLHRAAISAIARLTRSGTTSPSPTGVSISLVC